jgi:hypothetical protein
MAFLLLIPVPCTAVYPIKIEIKNLLTIYKFTKYLDGSQNECVDAQITGKAKVTEFRPTLTLKVTSQNHRDRYLGEGYRTPCYLFTVFPYELPGIRVRGSGRQKL